LDRTLSQDICEEEGHESVARWNVKDEMRNIEHETLQVETVR